IEKKGNVFHVTTDSGKHTSYAVIVATGAKHKKLGIKGEDEFSGRGVSYCATCDGPFFKNKKILVVGGGDAACDEATYLSKLTDKVVMIHRKDRFRAQKSLAERVEKNKNIEIRFNTECREIKGSAKVEKVVLETTDGKKYEEDFDAVFIFIGSLPQTQVIPDVTKDEAGFVIADCNMETSTKGLFVAGDIRDTPFRQIIVACGDGAIAAHSAALLIDELQGNVYI
ncbi:MAG: FAD-dependent oxidoreductase, partial [Spirochaetia bacterium]|nr:FAD-dependent oxidoreductase [Spirochaetia bacterium]